MRLPYAVVMATGAASQLAAPAGVPAARAPLLWLAVAEALWIAGSAGADRRRSNGKTSGRRAVTGPPDQYTGALTVPLGVAVVGSGLAETGNRAAELLGVACLILAWFTAALLVARFILATWRARGSSGPSDASDASDASGASIDGSWFLAPAAILGASICASAYAAHTGGNSRTALQALAAAGAVTGLVGYWALVAAAIPAVAVRPMAGSGAAEPAVANGNPGRNDPWSVLWWIAAGCGGLAAAALGKTVAAHRSPFPALWVTAMRDAGLVTWLAAAVVLVPILIASVAFLARWRPPPRPAVPPPAAPLPPAAPPTRIRPPARTAPLLGTPSWPPTFSTGVFALGALATGASVHLGALVTAGRVGAIATVALWVSTVVLLGIEMLARAFGQGKRSVEERRRSP